MVHNRYAIWKIFFRCIYKVICIRSDEHDKMKTYLDNMQKYRIR